MGYIIYNSKQEAVAREHKLTADGIAGKYFPANECYCTAALFVNHPSEDKAAIEVFRSPGIVLSLTEDDILPVNHETLFTPAELATEVEQLSEDWYQTT